MKLTQKTLFLFIIAQVYAQTDGNPHKWDRLRRCDNEGYDVPCGLCEGIGGIVTGDELDKITITKCTPVSDAKDLPTEAQVPPKFETVFSNEGFYENLISQKTNPFCVGGFPGPDSTGDHCYSAQQGQFYYDWTNKNLMINYEQIQGHFYNSSALIYHQRGNMWIVNNLGLGIKQCICTQPGRRFGIEIYPIRPDFMEQNSRLIGREKLYIEFLNEEKLVDHWIKGPHHIWKDVETGYIIRMWQPWNGLEVFDPKKWKFSLDVDMQTPPAQCKSGFGKWTIKCDENGNPASKTSFLE